MARITEDRFGERSDWGGQTSVKTVGVIGKRARKDRLCYNIQEADVI